MEGSGCGSWLVEFGKCRTGQVKVHRQRKVFFAHRTADVTVMLCGQAAWNMFWRKPNIFPCRTWKRKACALPVRQYCARKHFRSVGSRRERSKRARLLTLLSATSVAIGGWRRRPWAWRASRFCCWGGGAWRLAGRGFKFYKWLSFVEMLVSRSSQNSRTPA